MLYSLESRQSGLGLADAFFTAFSAGTCTGLATFNITAFGGAAKALLASVVACSAPSPYFSEASRRLAAGAARHADGLRLLHPHLGSASAPAPRGAAPQRASRTQVRD